MNSDRFRFFPSVHQQSDLLIGVSHADFQQNMAKTSLDEQIRLYTLLNEHAKAYPPFRESLEPLQFPGRNFGRVPELDTMYRCGERTGTGPMSCVAGLFAERIAHRLAMAFDPAEMVVENGGDLYIRNRSDVVTVIHAGNSPLSEKIGLIIPGGTWGVCTSSGTLGHSYSMGKADAVTVVSKSTSLADAWATSMANRVQDPDDIEPVLDQVTQFQEILACVVIAGDKMGIRGTIELKLLS